MWLDHGKARLVTLRGLDWTDRLPAVARGAAHLDVEGTVCKRLDAPYSSGRGHDWLKLKCQQREEFIVLGWTPPAGSRSGHGSLHLGFYDQQAGLHHVGGVGTGFSGNELTQLRERLNRLAAPAPKDLLVAGDPLDPSIHWVRPKLVAEVQYAGWSGAGRVRQAVYLGLREDKPAKEVVRELPDADAERGPVAPRTPAGGPPATRIVTARAPKREGRSMIGNVTLTHPDRELWPGITKRDLAEYWQAVAEAALPGIAGRPLAVVRCPDGIDGERFFQKHGQGMPPQIHQGEADGQPYLAIDGVDGLVAMAQMAAIELHPWGATEADPLHPDRIVFDLDPGEGVPFEEVVKSAREVRDRLAALGLTTFCRTTGGKGLHVVAPLTPKAGWDEVKPFCRDFAETISREHPDRYLSTVKKADRKGRILVDWLRNGLGATAISSYCPRARPGAAVATPLSWDEVGAKLDPGVFTLQSVPRRLQRLQKDPWAGFTATPQELPAAEPKSRKTR